MKWLIFILLLTSSVAHAQHVVHCSMKGDKKRCPFFFRITHPFIKIRKVEKIFHGIAEREVVETHIYYYKKP